MPATKHSRLDAPNGILTIGENERSFWTIQVERQVDTLHECPSEKKHRPIFFRGNLPWPPMFLITKELVNKHFMLERLIFRHIFHIYKTCAYNLFDYYPYIPYIPLIPLIKQCFRAQQKRDSTVRQPRPARCTTAIATKVQHSSKPSPRHFKKTEPIVCLKNVPENMAKVYHFQPNMFHDHIAKVSDPNQTLTKHVVQ